MNLSAQQPFWFNPLRSSPPKDASGDGRSDYPPSPISPQGARSIIGIGETGGLNHLGFLHLPWTVVSRAIEVCCQQHLRCHPDLTGQMDQDIPDKVDNTERKHA